MEIKIVLRPIDWLDYMPHGYACGYVGVPPEHPWFGKHYDDIDCDIHGGLTLGDNHLPNKQPDGLWWVGFDTCHYNDDIENCSKEYCEQQLASLKQQAEEAINNPS